MYKQNRRIPTSVKVNQSYEGERIEEKIHRITNNKEPIKDGAPLIYSERKDGVLPEYNIRTDRWEIAVDAMDKVTGSHRAKREERLKGFEAKLEKANGKGDGGAEPLGGTGGEPKA